jgi:uncharacterized protein YhaN
MLRRVELTCYGAFRGRSVDLGPGLTVVVGPNESGKSTLRAALGDLLWGLQPRLHPYAFTHAPSALRVTADLVDPDDPSATRTVVVDSRGTWDGDERVDPWWTAGSITSRDAWEKALGLSLAGLREGTQAVVDGGGDLQQLVYRARTGLDLEAERQRLAGRADELFKWRASNKSVKVRTQAALVASRRDAVAAATSAADLVVALREASGAARAELADAVRALAEAKTALDVAERERRCLPVVHDLRDVRERLGELDGTGRLLGADELAAHDSAVLELADLDERIASLRTEVESLSRRIDAVDVDPELADLRGAVDALVRKEASAREARDHAVALAHHVAQQRDGLRTLLRRLDPQAASVDDSGLVAAATSALLPSDVLGQIDREAQRVSDAEELADQARAEADDAVERSTALSGEVDTTATAALGSARLRRDDAWRDVRDPWLAGVDLPADGRAVLAAALDAAHDDLDDAIDRAALHAEATGRAGEADEQAALRLRAADEADAALAVARREWADALRAAGVPAALDVEAWDERRATLEALADAVDALEEATRGRVTAEALVAEFERDVAALVGSGSVDAWVALAGLRDKVDRAVAGRERRETLGEQRDEKAEALHVLTGRRDDVASRLAAFESAGLDAVLARSRDRLALVERESELVEQLRLAAGLGVQLDDLLLSLAGASAADAEASVLDAGAQLELCTQRHADAHTAAALAARELEDAERTGSAAVLRSEEQEEAERLAALVDEFLQTKVQIALLERVLAADSGDGVPDLLAHAERLAQELTAGRVRRLVVDEVEGRRHLRVDADDLVRGTPQELSEGTADQVYLALRLAGIREQQAAARAAGSPALPVVLDDVLQAHDDRRTEAALAVLVAEARDQQIVLLTHHEAVGIAAAAAGATVVHLEPRSVGAAEADVEAPKPKRRRAIRAVPALPDPAALEAAALEAQERAVAEQQLLDTYQATHDTLPGMTPDEAAESG